MAVKINTEDYIKLQLSGATQTDVVFSGDIKKSREMPLSKPFEVYKSLESNGFIVTKRFKIIKVNVAPDSLNILSLISNKGDELVVDEVGIDKNEVTIKYCERLIEEGNSKIRKGTNMLLQMVKGSIK